MRKLAPSAQADEWPFYDQLAVMYRAADELRPARSAVGLLEIADEEAATYLLALIMTLAPEPELALAGAQEILAALNFYRNERDFQARPAAEPIRKLMRARPNDQFGILQKLLSNPDVARPLLAQLLAGARRAGIKIPEQDRETATGATGGFDETGQWALQLAMNSAEFQRILNEALANQPTDRERLDLVRRLRDLAKKPTRRRFCCLLRRARKAGRMTFETIASAFRYAARRTFFSGRALQPNWLKEVGNNPAGLAAVAGEAHKLLKKGLHGQGGVPNDDMEHYCSKCARIYEALTSHNITYSKATENSKGRPPGQAYGEGLRFMRLAMRMVDASVTDTAARYRLDQLREARAR